MNKFTKALAAFCAMTMVFGAFSANVFAGEEEQQFPEEPAIETPAEEAGDDFVAADPDAAAEPEEQEPEVDEKEAKQAEKEAKEEKQAEKEAEKEAKKEEKAEEKAAKEQAKADGKKSSSMLLGTVPADGEGEGESEGQSTSQGQDINNGGNNGENAPVLFANGQITQTDIDNNGGKLPDKSGIYTLASNIVVPNHSHIDAAGTNITIDLNGHTITYTGDENLYTIGKVEDVEVDGQKRVVVHGNITLKIKDTKTGGMIRAANRTRGDIDHWISINGNYPSHGTEGRRRGGCILVQNSCTFILEGGEINGFHSESDGAAIHVSNGGICIINGGMINNCICDSIKPADDGGAVSCHCTSKGYQIGNIYYISVEGEEAFKTTLSLNGRLTINGGSITNCSGQQGGAVRVLRAQLELNGGTITNNTAANGGGIMFTKGNTGYFKISGNPVVYGNSSSSAVKKANVFFADNATAEFSNSLSSDAKIAFGANSSVTQAFFDTKGNSYSIDSFVCDHSGYYAYAAGNSIKIRQISAPKVSGYQIGLAGEIRLKVYVDFGTHTASEVALKYQYSYTKAGQTEYNFDVPVATDSLFTDSNGSYFWIPVPASCMATDITTTLTFNNEDIAYTTTIEDIAYNIIDGADTNPEYAEYKDLATKLLIYGGYAQVQLQINTDKIPNVEGIDFNVAPDYGLTSATYAPATDPDGAYAGCNVVFVSQVEVKLRFLKSELGDTPPAMTVEFAEGSKSIDGVASGNYYVYTIKGYDGEGFKASKYNEPFEFTVGSVNGEFSVYTYLQVIYGTGSQPMKNLAQAYYNFVKEAARFA